MHDLLEQLHSVFNPTVGSPARVPVHCTVLLDAWRFTCLSMFCHPTSRTSRPLPLLVIPHIRVRARSAACTSHQPAGVPVLRSLRQSLRTASPPIPSSVTSPLSCSFLILVVPLRLSLSLFPSWQLEVLPFVRLLSPSEPTFSGSGGHSPPSLPPLPSQIYGCFATELTGTEKKTLAAGRGQS